jgi:hypothetical protein
VDLPFTRALYPPGGERLGKNSTAGCWPRPRRHGGGRGPDQLLRLTFCIAGQERIYGLVCDVLVRLSQASPRKLVTHAPVYGTHAQKHFHLQRLTSRTRKIATSYPLLVPVPCRHGSATCKRASGKQMSCRPSGRASEDEPPGGRAGVLAVVSEPWASGSDEPWAGWLAATSLGLAAVSGWLAATVERRADGRACRQRPTSSWLAVAGERWVAATCRTGAASSRCTEERERVR